MTPVPIQTSLCQSASNFLQPMLDAVLAGELELELPLHDEGGVLVGIMRPLNIRHLEHTEVIEKLTAWRNENMANFLTHFVATNERTRTWIQNVLVKARGQILFLVYSDENVVGHFGFKELTQDTVLLDNAMRGDRQGHAKLFVFAGKALVHWLINIAGVQRVHAYVMADNVPSLMMNRQIGFSSKTRHPLIKRMHNDDIHWEIGSETQSSPDGRYCFQLQITREQSRPT